jgi:arginine repressor
MRAVDDGGSNKKMGGNLPPLIISILNLCNTHDDDGTMAYNVNCSLRVKIVLGKELVMRNVVVAVARVRESAILKRHQS